jgi:hypothetical protein
MSASFWLRAIWLRPSLLERPTPRAGRPIGRTGMLCRPWRPVWHDRRHSTRADIPHCQPRTPGPTPLVLVQGRFGSQNDYWQAIAPALANAGDCVYTLKLRPNLIYACGVALNIGMRAPSSSPPSSGLLSGLPAPSRSTSSDTHKADCSHGST